MKLFISNSYVYYFFRMADLTAEGLLVELEKLFGLSETLASNVIAKQIGVDHQKIVGLIKSIRTGSIRTIREVPIKRIPNHT